MLKKTTAHTHTGRHLRTLRRRRSAGVLSCSTHFSSFIPTPISHKREPDGESSHTHKQTLFIPPRCYTPTRVAWHHAKCYNESSYCDTTVTPLFSSLFSHPKGRHLHLATRKSVTVKKKQPASEGLKKEAQVPHREKRSKDKTVREPSTIQSKS